MFTRSPSPALFSALAPVLFLACSQTALAGTITVEQKAAVGPVGEWRLSMPSGGTVSGDADVPSRSVNSTASGTYLMTVKPPKSAHVSITVLSKEGVAAKSAYTALQTKLSGSEDYRIVIAYSYDGTVTVNSEPQGAPFVLVGAPEGVRRSGVTPAVFTDLPPYYYSVNYGRMEDCSEPKPQKRTETNPGNVVFGARYVCGTPKPAQEPKPSADANAVISTSGDASVWLAPHQSEVTAGSELTYTVGVKNNGTRTQHDLTVSLQYDPAAMNIEKMLPHGGTVIGNTVIWDVSEVYAGQTWSISFPVRIRESVVQGAKMSATARVSGPEIDPSIAKVLSATAEVGAAYIPKTGYSTESVLIIATLAVTHLLLSKIRRKTLRE